jgi:hypothetical protein
MTQIKPQVAWKSIIVTIVSLLILSACLPAQPPESGAEVGTVVAQTLEAMTAAAPAPTQPTGLPVSYNNISFTIPIEMNASAAPSTNTDVEFPAINPSGGPMAEHVTFQLTNYPVQGDAQIMVFKASEYAAYGPPMQEAVSALLVGQDTVQPLPETLLQGEFFAQSKPVAFKNGHGVRYLTQVLTNFAPITNDEIFYYYQGITADGAYFVSAVLDLNAPFLVANGSMGSATPPDGVPFDNSVNLDFPAYLSAVTKKLNDAPQEGYTPSLLMLDTMIESLQITTP